MGARQHRMRLVMVGSGYMNSQPRHTRGSANTLCFSKYLSGQSSAASFVILKPLRGTQNDGCAESPMPPALWRTGGQRVHFYQAENRGEENLSARIE